MTVFAKSPDGLRIGYETAGDGPPVLLIHGFGSSRAQNWRATGWYKTLAEAGFRVIAMDCRGHGDSDKPHDPACYGYTRMAADALAVLEAVDAGRVDVVGYSMGGYLGIELLMNRPEIIDRLAIAGVGETYFVGTRRTRLGIARALEEPDPGRISDPVERQFRAFADQPGKDRAALAACMRGDRTIYPPAELGRVEQPVLVVCGGNDTISGAPGPLAAAFRDGRAVTVPGRDHMSAVGDKATKAAVLEFFAK